MHPDDYWFSCECSPAPPRSGCFRSIGIGSSLVRAASGLWGAERGNPPTKFRHYFSEARRRGFQTTIHAGEEGPVDYVKQALHELKVDRIDHGNAALADAETMHYLAKTTIPLPLCPQSNVCLKILPTLADHPVKKMLQADLRVPINSDDPAYFGGYVAENWQQCQQALHLTRPELVQLAHNSFESAFIADSLKEYYLGKINAFTQRWSAQVTSQGTFSR